MSVVYTDNNKELPPVNGVRFNREHMMAHAQLPMATSIDEARSNVTNIQHHHKYLLNGRTLSGKGNPPKHFQEWAQANPNKEFPTNPVELPASCGQGLASTQSAGGKHHVFEEGSEPDKAGLSVH